MEEDRLFKVITKKQKTFLTKEAGQISSCVVDGSKAKNFNIYCYMGNTDLGLALGKRIK